uniref:Uncharacterized protein n=1 Tax=Salmo trutta TaxID=8032 RepID=A0A674DMD6_SALTR
TRRPALLSLYQVLKKKKVSKPLMVSLGNIEEQLRAFQKIQIRLHFKLLQAVDKMEDTCYLQSVRDAISNQVSGASLLYEQNIDTLATCTQRSAVAPSIADMLEWLQDAGCYYRQQRRNVLQTLRADDLCLRETAPKRSGSLKTISEEASISGEPIYGALFSVYRGPSKTIYTP